METQINRLQSTFNCISNTVNDIDKLFELLRTQIQCVKQTYKEFIDKHKEDLFVFCLDSFYYQGKLIDIEYNDIYRLNACIVNRMYCSYYKLYKIIKKKAIEMCIKTSDSGSFPVYLDLEPYAYYDFEHIQNVYSSITELLHNMNTYLISKETELVSYTNKKETGLYLDNFVATVGYNNTLVNEQIQLYVHYIDFFHKINTLYLARILEKLKLTREQLNHDIQFDDNIIIHVQEERQ